MVRLELEDVGVHLEDQQVVGHLYLGFELAPVTVFEPHAPVEESVQLVVHFGSHLQQGFFQVVECGERVVENLLFERRFAYDGFEDFLSQGMLSMLYRRIDYRILIVVPGVSASPSLSLFRRASDLVRMP